MSKDMKLNNLLGIEEYSENDFNKKSKTTKRTEVAKDIFEKAEVTGKDVFSEDKLKNKQEIVNKKLNNLYSLDEYTEKDTLKVANKLHEKKGHADGCSCGKEDKKEPKVGLTAKQKKLPEALQKAILKRQNKKK